MNKFNPAVDFYFTKAGKWKETVQQLRMIILSAGLIEELKWGCPCYTLNKRNIVLIHDFKEYCALLFFKGALLKDTKGMLVQQTKNVQSARQLRFTTVQQVFSAEHAIKNYIKQAISLEKAGVKVELKKPEQFEMAEEFSIKLNKTTALKKAFYALTPGRQRAYLLFFAGAKQSATRASRVEKCIPLILKGKGLND